MQSEGDVPELSVFYATCTGNAQEIAKRICADAKALGFNAQLAGLDQYETLSLLAKTLVVIVAATTGDGEAPEHASKFYRHIRRRTHPNDMLGHMKFAVLALGDSNYSNFCACGATIDKRLGELGGNRFYARGEADDGVGLDIVVEPWIKGLFEKLVSMYPSIASKNEKKTGEEQNDSLDEKLSVSEAACKINVKLTNDPKISDTEVFEQSRVFQSKGLKVYSGRFKQAKYLTSQEALKQKLHMSIHTDESMRELLPGDSIAIYCSNKDEVVDRIVSLLDWDASAAIQIDPASGHDSSTISDVLLNIPKGIAVFQALKYYFDITGEVKLGLVKMLARVAQDPIQKQELQELSQDLDRFHKEITKAFVELSDLLQKYPSCKPTYSDLFDVLTPLIPRYFSVSSSTLEYDTTIDLCFTCVDDVKADGRVRMGLCTGNFQETANKIISGETSNDSVFFSIKPRCQFVYPTKVEKPMLLIAAGTGVAPFRAFVQYRAEQMQRCKGDEGVNPEEHKVPFGPVWLYMGCMHPNWDNLYQDEWESFLSQGVIEKHVVSFSRLRSDDRIHNRVLQDSAKVREFIVENDACVFICGQPGLVREADRVLHEILSAHSTDAQTTQETSALIRKWVDDGKYIREVWD